MSLEAMTWVFGYSEATLGDRLVLLGLADNANDSWRSYPSTKTLASKARLSKRQVQRCLRSLETTGRIVSVGRSEYDTTVYELVRDAEQDAIDRAARLAKEGGDKMSPGRQIVPEGVTYRADSGSDMSPEPSSKPKIERKDQEEDAPASGALFAVDADRAPEWQADEATALAILLEVPRANGSKRPELEAVEAVHDRHPELSMEQLARELLFYAVHGNGARRQIKSVMGTFATFAKRAADDRAVRASQNGGQRVASGGEAEQQQGWSRQDF
jgi:hypothetical protein